MIGKRKPSGCPFAKPEIPRSASTPAQPADCKVQNARFLLPKKGWGRISMTGIGLSIARHCRLGKNRITSVQKYAHLNSAAKERDMGGPNELRAKFSSM